MRYMWLASIFLAITVGCTTENPFEPPPSPPPPAEPPPATHPIVFSSLRDTTYGPRNNEILVVRTDGTDPVNLSRNAASDVEPSWSPDGQQIAFASNRSGSFDIYVMKNDGSELKRITSDTMDERRPRWSPDGRKILFESGHDGLLTSEASRFRYTDIFVTDVDGSHVVNLTRTPSSSEVRSAWSPDAKTIAFARDGAIMLIDADGSNERRLHPVDAGFSDDAVAWSPDGKILAYSAFNLNHPQYTDTYVIFTVNADGSNVRRITGLGYSSARFPSFSPDGTKIVYNRDAVDEFWGRFSTQNLYLMNVDGSGSIQITTDQSSRNELGGPQAWTR